MKIEKLSESGYPNALIGVALSYSHSTHQVSIERAKVKLTQLAHGKSSERKYIRAIEVTFLIKAPRFWLTEIDTYKIGTIRMSGSTMHTITKNRMTQDDFEYPAFQSTIDELNELIDEYKETQNSARHLQLFLMIKNNLPEGYLQKTVWSTNYQVLQNVYNDRLKHKLPQWTDFCNFMLQNLEHPELITK